MSELKSILYIEDNPVIIKIVGHVVARMDNVEMTVSSSAADAKQCLKERRYHLVIFDNDLPDGSGLSVIEEAVSSADALDQTALMAVTARVSDDYLQRCEELNVEAIFEKPFVMKSFNEALSRLLFC